MWIREAVLAVLGFIFGLAAAGGVFAFLIMLGIIPRIIGKTRTADKILTYENAVITGGILGNVLSVFPMIRLPDWRILLVLYGFPAGVYVGCLSMALAEILKTFPVMFRRIRLKMGLNWIIWFFAAGKVGGAFFYFFSGLASGG